MIAQSLSRSATKAGGARHRSLDFEWLPDEWRKDYHNWISNKGFTAIEAKRIIMDHIAVRGLHDDACEKLKVA